MSKYISKKNKEKVLKRADRLCEYCLAPMDYAFHPFCIDHIIPQSKDGEDLLKNLALSCQNCNSHKYNKIEGIDPLTHRKVSLFHPRNEDWKKHFEWSENWTVIIGISTKGRATVSTLKMNLPAVINLRQALVEFGVHPPNSFKNQT